MKKLIILVIVLYAGSLTAQVNNDTSASGFARNMEVAANSNPGFGSTTILFNPAKKPKGSVHLFDSWKNQGVIHTIDGQKFSISNINFNIDRNAFESKIGEDSLFTFNFNNIKMFVVNGKNFKNYFHEGTNRIFQSLYEQKDYEILKGYRVELVKGSTDPMLNRPDDKFVQKGKYYIRQNGTVQFLKLKKKNMLQFVGGDSKKAKELIEFLKKQ